jgi:D-alanine-D-alanine ligase-like ATP-grasp enzyme
MADITSLRQLDTVLNSLKTHAEEIALHDLKIILEKEGSVFNTGDLRKLLQKIVKNEFATEGNYNHYTITKDGQIFEGYEKQYLATVSENSRLDALESELKENRKWTLYLTILIAAGTLVAAIYYLYFLIQDLCWCEFVWQHHKS